MVDPPLLVLQDMPTARCCSPLWPVADARSGGADCDAESVGLEFQTMRTDDRDAQAASFGQAAAAYARARPGYPAEAVRWMLRGVPERVLDLGAGTGALTKELARTVPDVVAVERSIDMLREVRGPHVARVAGVAEALPLRRCSVDAVFVAQAWHWFDHDVACREAARVLRPGGSLCLVWNIRDESVEWVAQLGAVMHSGGEYDMRSENPPVAPPFGAVERRDFRWAHELARGAVLDLVASRSYVIALDSARRLELLQEVEQLLAEHPALKGKERVSVPYVTRCAVAFSQHERG